MSGAGELAGALGSALGQLPTDQLQSAASWLDEQGRPILTEIAQGSSSDELAEAAALFERAHELIKDALALCGSTREHVLTYLAVLGVEQHGGRPPTLPHPSTIPRAPSDAAYDQQWADRTRERLPVWGYGDPTRGLFLGPDGIEVDLVSGRDEREDDSAARAALWLINSPLFPQHRLSGTAGPEVAKHVEAKAAQRMREQGITYGVIAINNPVCDDIYGCEAAIPAILPYGYTLAVWEPNATRPRIFKGKA